MPEANLKRRNGALFMGGVLTLIAVLSQGLYFLNIGGQKFIPWLNLLLAAMAVIYFIIGLRRAFGQPGIYRGKIAGGIFGTISLVLFALTVWLFVHARDLPAPYGAPKVGEKAPAFTLADTSGQAVSLGQLLSTPASSQAAPPKAVLLVFYRGYW